MAPSIPGTPLAGAGSTGYLNIAGSDLLASSFGLIDTTTGNTNFAFNPDFNSGPITFGIGQFLSETGILNDNPTVVYDYDNLAISVNSTVPEPLTLSILGAGLLGVASMRRRNNRKA